ncbi:MAG: AAA family ATPase, partial [Oxalobacter sp.]|nr:AAA family ATPase [Oxalobacter sp.]
QVTCEPKWESALEVVLQERMQAIELSNLSWADGLSKSRLPGKLVFFSSIGVQRPSYGNDGDLTSLVSFISVSRDDIKTVLQNWLSGIFTKSSIAEAIKDRDRLPEGASFIVPEGHRVDRYSVRLFAAESENEGFFQRINEIARLESQERDLELALKEATDKARDVSTVLKELQTALERLRRERTVLTEKLGEIRLVILKEEERQRHYVEQQEQIALGFEAIDSECQEKQEEIVLHEQLLEELDGRLSEAQEKEDAFRVVVETAEEKLLRERESCHAIEKQIQQALFAQQTLKRSVAELERQVEFAKGQVAKAQAGIVASQGELGNLEAGVQENALQELLEKRLMQEKSLTEKREALENTAQSLRKVMEKRIQLENQLQPQQERIVALQLKEQEARLNASQQAAKLSEAGVDEDELAQELPENAKSSSLQGEVTRLTNEISAMGLVNLAAAQELEEGKKRRQYLKEQHQDLTDAIATLEDAIKRIDRETRQQLKDTFDRVNASLDELFPILFGGGKAQLIMSGDEILDAGIQIMAQPPGKKNATIHLLSGGEKALTALALVFSLFQLNPAPFCLLDEVDAPLDDANTARFSSLVEKMSAQTQFLFISHNQIAMAMAEELIGVTMQEKGVSRIVSVDLDKAGEFAEKGQA